MDFRDFFIMHEMQESELCGQHCLNNLLQQPVFDAVALSEIAQSLDQMENDITKPGYAKPEISGNVNDQGNFSFSVLQCALRSFEIELTSWTGLEGREHHEPSSESAFIVNRSNHWFTLRKINRNWWNLDSMLEKPTHMSEMYLSAYLAQMRNEGCSIFIVSGNLPTAGRFQHEDSLENIGTIWYSETALLGRTSSSRDDEYDEDLALAKALSASLS